MIKIKMPKKVEEIISRLEENGFEAYAVGGCVRDSILQRVPDDWDITTSATPMEVKALFLHTIDTGIKHGTVTVMLGKEGFEVTTYRLDGLYSDGRHPDSISFTSSLTEDLRRRDFTINAMAYSHSKGLVDAFFGIDDLENHLIRAVGNPLERFGEDALRMLRAIRFSAQLGFRIEEETFLAIKTLAETIQKVSMERIEKELEKLLLSTGVDRIKQVYESGMMKYIIPSLDVFFKKEPEEVGKTISIMKRAIFEEKKDLFRIRLSILLVNLGEKKAGEILKNLKLDNETIDIVKRLIVLYHLPLENNRMEMRKTVHLAGKRLMPLLFSLRRSKGLDTGEELYLKVLEKKEATEISELMIDGNELIQLGIPKGKEVGEELKRLLRLVMINPSLNTKDRLRMEVDKREK